MIVDYRGLTLMDSFVRPTLPVSDCRTNVTGIVEANLVSGKHRILFLPSDAPPAVVLTSLCP